MRNCPAVSGDSVISTYSSWERNVRSRHYSIKLHSIEHPWIQLMVSKTKGNNSQDGSFLLFCFYSYIFSHFFNLLTHLLEWKLVASIIETTKKIILPTGATCRSTRG